MITKTGQELLTKEAFSFRAIPHAAKAFSSVFGRTRYGLTNSSNQTAQGFIPSFKAGIGAAKKTFRARRFGGSGYNPKGKYNFQPVPDPKYVGPVRKGTATTTTPTATTPPTPTPTSTPTSTPTPTTNPTTTPTTTTPSTPAQPKGRSLLGKAGIGLAAASVPLGGYGAYKHYSNQVQQPYNQPTHFQQLPQPQFYR